MSASVSAPEPDKGKNISGSALWQAARSHQAPNSAVLRADDAAFGPAEAILGMAVTFLLK
jgi:hypothetical protein